MNTNDYGLLFPTSVVGSMPRPDFVKDLVSGETIGVAYPIKVVKELGLLDTRLPQYRADHEWAHRAKTLGIDVMVSPQAICETVIDTQARICAERPITSYWEVLFSRRSPANLLPPALLP